MQLSPENWLTKSTIDLTSGSRLAFMQDTFEDYIDFLGMVKAYEEQGVMLPVVHLFKNKYHLYASSHETICTALDLTISNDANLLDFTDLNRLQLTAMFLSTTNLERTDKEYFNFVEKALQSSHPNTFRSSRLYSRALLDYWRNRGNVAAIEFIEHAVHSERILYALNDLNNDGHGDALYGLPIQETLDAALTTHYQAHAVYEIVKELHDEPLDRIDAMSTLIQPAVLKSAALPDRMLQ